MMLSCYYSVLKAFNGIKMSTKQRELPYFDRLGGVQGGIRENAGT